MVEPARKLGNDSNKDRNRGARERAAQHWGMSKPAESTAELSESEANSSATPARERADKRWGMSPAQLGTAEQEAKDPAVSPVENQENKALTPNDQLGRGFRPETSRARAKAGSKKKYIVIVVLFLLTGGSFGALSLLHGPFQLIHLAQILSKPSRANDTAISNRTGGLLGNLRANRTGDVGETRVGILGSKRFRAVEAQLAEKGITFERLQYTGRPTAINVDAARNPKFNKGSPAEQQRAIAEFYSRNVSDVVSAGEGRWKIDTTKLGSKIVRSLTDTSLRSLENGELVNAANKRIFHKFFDLPSIFHPIEQTKSDLTFKYGLRQEALARERARQTEREPNLLDKYKDARSKLDSALEPHKTTITGALFVVGTLCIVRDLAGDIPKANFAAAVVPSILAANDKQAVGSQAMSGQDFTLGQLGDVSESLKNDNGQTVWGSKPLNALANGGPGEGQDIEDEYKQAFSENTTAGNIRKGLDKFGATGLACSKPGLLVQLLVSAALVITPGPGWAAKAATFGVETVATGVAINFFGGKIVDRLKADPVAVFSGPLGGSLLAYGARAGANLNAMSMGGIALSKSESKLIAQETDAQDKQAFQQRGLLARMFDLDDYRSFASTTLRSSSFFSFKKLPTILAHISSSPLHILNNPSLSLVSKASAAEEDYDWDFPLYSIPREILNDPRYEDNYDNANKAATLLSSSQGASYVDKAKKCFGVEIAKGGYGWDSTQVEEVNPTDPEYIDAGCNNTNDENWTRIMLFVFDTSIVTNVDCYAGEAEACQKIGFDGGGETASTATDVPPVFIVGGDTSNLTCQAGTDAGVGDGYKDGKLYKIRLCNVQGITVNAQIAKNIDALLTAAKAATLKISGGGFRTMQTQIALRIAHNCPNIYTAPASSCDPDTARPGYSNHQMGLAIDFNCNGLLIQNTSKAGTRQTSPSNPCWQWLEANATTYGLQQLNSEAWHWSVDGK